MVLCHIVKTYVKMKGKYCIGGLVAFLAVQYVCGAGIPVGENAWKPLLQVYKGHPANEALQEQPVFKGRRDVRSQLPIQRPQHPSVHKSRRLSPVLMPQQWPYVQAPPQLPVVQESPQHPYVHAPQQLPAVLVPQQWLPQTPMGMSFESGPPVNSDIVTAECREGAVVVMVQRDLFRDGLLVEPSAVSLGNCPPTRQDYSGQVLVFESELQNCGSMLTMTDDMLVYIFNVIYKPTAFSAAPIIRHTGAVVHVVCYYLRKHNASSNALMPDWLPLLSTEAAQESLDFSLRLMTDDWQLERASDVYFLGDVINVEASVVVTNHLPLRVFVDSCVATLVPDANALPRYAFIENHGCLLDGKLTGSRSKFLPRTQDHKLQLQLDVFSFIREDGSSIYITCSLKATVTSAASDSQYKACSFATDLNRWMSVSEDDQVCACCDTTCELSRKRKSLAGDAVLHWEDDVAVGPIFIQEKLQMF